MSHVIHISKVNQFLPLEKLQLNTTIQGSLPVDHPKMKDLEETARDIVLAKLSTKYVTAGWFVDAGGGSPVEPPSLVTNIVAMLVAGWVYDRQFAEEATEGSSYGTRKVAEAYALLDQLIVGSLDIGMLFIDNLDDTASSLETEPIFTMDSRV